MGETTASGQTTAPEEPVQEEKPVQEEEQFQKEKPVQEKPSYLAKLKSFFIECRRVLQVTKKPDKLEFKTIVKVSGLGIIVIGLVGFVISMFKVLFLA